MNFSELSNYVTESSVCNSAMPSTNYSFLQVIFWAQHVLDLQGCIYRVYSNTLSPTTTLTFRHLFVAFVHDQASYTPPVVTVKTQFRYLSSLCTVWVIVYLILSSTRDDTLYPWELPELYNLTTISWDPSVLLENTTLKTRYCVSHSFWSF